MQGLREALGLACLLCVLAACSPFSSEPYTTSTEPAALMALVRPGWQAAGPESMILRTLRGTDASAPAETERRSLQPVLIAPLSTTRLLLIVAGTPADAGGSRETGSSTPASLDAYWFGKRGNRWYRIGEHEDFTRTGANGLPGELRTTALDARRKALVIENGSCRLGRCARWLNLFAIGIANMQPLLPNGEPVQLGAETDSPGERCRAMLRMRPGSHGRMALDEFSPRAGCHAITGRWYLESRNDAPDRLTINLSGTRVTARRVVVEPDEEEVDRRIEEAIARGGECCAPPPPVREEYLATVNTVNSQIVYRYADGHYEALSGSFPLPAL